MTQRVFSPKCSNCRQRAMALTPVLYCAKISHDGREYNVHIPALIVPKCGNCGNISLDDEANREIDVAFRREGKLFTPEEIRKHRESLGLNQQQFADWFGVAVSTLSRWETGGQIQQRVMNDFMRAFFEVSAFRDFLKALRGLSPSPGSPPDQLADDTEPASFPFEPAQPAPARTVPVLPTASAD